MHPNNSLLSLLLLPIVLISALPEPSSTTTPPALLPRASLTPAESSLLANNYAAWTTSIAQVSASAAHVAAVAAYTPPVLQKNDLASPDNNLPSRPQQARPQPRRLRRALHRHLHQATRFRSWHVYRRSMGVALREERRLLVGVLVSQRREGRGARAT